MTSFLAHVRLACISPLRTLSTSQGTHGLTGQSSVSHFLPAQGPRGRLSKNCTAVLQAHPGRGKGDVAGGADLSGSDSKRGHSSPSYQPLSVFCSET